MFTFDTLLQQTTKTQLIFIIILQKSFQHQLVIKKKSNP